nr:putative reverse transcriptase domain-containing protein [Tanacetum cinerariifolium]
LLKDYDTNIQYHPRKANVVANALRKKSGMIAGIKVEEESIRDLEWLDIELYTEFRFDEDDVLWQGTRLCVPNDATLREALLTEAHSSPFSVHPVGEHVIEGLEIIEVTNEKVVSGMIAGINVEEEIIRDLERLDIKLYVRGQHGYWASLRVEPDLISRIKEAQKEDNEIWTIVENLEEQAEFRLDEDDVLWQGTRLCAPNDATLREALLTEAHSSPFSVHPGSTKMYHDLKQHFWWSGMKRDVPRLYRGV